MAGSWCRDIKKLTLSLLILCGLAVSLFSQDKNIGGVVNVYRRVVAIGPGTNTVTVNSIDSIAPNDTIMLIQMKGAMIYTAPLSYGNLADTIGTPGAHEFLLVLDTAGNKITFKNNITTSFDVSGDVQLIRVPFYNTATVNSKLTAKTWDPVEKTGGVLAVIVGGKLKLDADIDVSAKGFAGGKDTIGIGICANSNASYLFPAYSSSFTNAGYKGEGIASHDNTRLFLGLAKSKGFGSNYTGGGGGNGKFSGGGGGSNIGVGVRGNSEPFDATGVSGCDDPFDGGFRGLSVGSWDALKDGIYFGGGGGASTHFLGSNESNGGRGGGIVFIIAGTISGNGKWIKAEGASTVGAGLNGGAGGGGAGGSIVISLQSFSTIPEESLKLSVRGGNGALSAMGNGYGTGGSGGGGLIWVNEATSLPPEVLTNLAGGFVDIDFAGAGGIKYNFAPKLNGFLFNSIRSDVTLNQVDSICSNMPFVKISGTIPVGGKPPHTFLWQSSTISDIAGFGPATNANTGQDYVPGILNETTWFRRVVKDNDTPVLKDTSLAVKIIVHQEIKKTEVISSDTICWAQDPPAFTSKEPLQDGNGKYSFVWKVSTRPPDSTIFKIPANLGSYPNTNEGYTPPPALKIDSWYKRIVTSGRCVDSTAIVKIEVLDTIKNNKILSLPQEICFGTPFADLTATTPTSTPDTLKGGDGSYRFLWQTNVNGTGWVTAPGVNNLSGYNPVEQIENPLSNLNLFRRVVKSGMHDVCVNTSKTLLLTDFPIIKDNTVSADQTICHNWAPAKLVGSITPTLKGGNGIYTYAWEVSSVTVPAWTIIPGATGADYQPPKLLETTRYRRVVSSSLCSDISAPVIVKVDKPITNNIVSLAAGGADTTICNSNQISFLKGLTALGGNELAYSYKWVRSPDNATWADVSTASALTNYNPPALTAATVPTDYYFKRKVTSGACIDTLSASRIKVTVLPVISNNNITPDKPKVCYGIAPAAPITGLIPVSGGAGTGTYIYSWEQSTNGGTSWVAAVGVTNSSGGIQPPALTVETLYKRKVVSGGFVCSSHISDPVTIGINQLPTASITSTTPLQICYPGNTVPLDINITGSASPWKVIVKENGVAGSINTVATNNPTLAVTPTTSTGLASYSYSYTLGSVEDANGCLATSLLNARPIVIYKTPVPNAGVDADTCGLVYKLRAIPTVGITTGAWASHSSASFTGTTAKSTVTVAPFAGGSADYWFVWKEDNGVCPGKDSIKVRFYKEITAVNPAGKDTAFYTFTNLIPLNAKPLEAWETGLWALEGGEGIISDPSSSSTSISGLGAGDNFFSWTIKNGSCSLKDLINIAVFDIVVPEGFSPSGDGVNEMLIVKGLDLTSQTAEMTIVNSTGSVVFTTTSKDWKDWDGKDSRGNDVSEGTYFYILQLTSTDPKSTGVVKKLSGFIILKRYK